MFNQICMLSLNELPRQINLPVSVIKVARDELCRELGCSYLVKTQSNSVYDEDVSVVQECGDFISERYDLWNDSHGSAGVFISTKISLIELIFRKIEAFVLDREENRSYFEEAVRELNYRFRASQLPLVYRNGYLQFSDAEEVEQAISGPTWSVLSGADWSNADRELKEAFDRRDNNKDDVGFHAAKALESVIKVISDNLGRTSGSEKGAANYIDNLVSTKLGRFIEPWEADQLKSYFSNIRNPQGHGRGAEAAPEVAEHQKEWSIGFSMIWIRALIRRYELRKIQGG
tara:strand:- start:52 stop:915 length:864 start_codon:yes stop_codon:yes gene_type:complete